MGVKPNNSSDKIKYGMSDTKVSQGCGPIVDERQLKNITGYQDIGIKVISYFVTVGNVCSGKTKEQERLEEQLKEKLNNMKGKVFHINVPIREGYKNPIVPDVKLASRNYMNELLGVKDNDDVYFLIFYDTVEGNTVIEDVDLKMPPELRKTEAYA